jgi:hypothetical protein
MDIITALKLRHTMSYGIKPIKTSVTILPEVKQILDDLANKYGYSQSVMVQVALIILLEQHFAEQESATITPSKKTEITDAPVEMEVVFEDAYGDDYEPA